MSNIKNMLLKLKNQHFNLASPDLPKKSTENENNFFPKHRRSSTQRIPYFNFNKTSMDFSKRKNNGAIRSHTKRVKFAKTSYDDDTFPDTDNFKISMPKTIDNSKAILKTEEKDILPFIKQENTLPIKPNPTSLKINDIKSNDRISNIKTIFSKNENKKRLLSKKPKIIDENKYRYSIIIKNLDIWDKDHCEKNKDDINKNLFNLLYQYFDENKLLEEKNDLIYASNVIKSRQSHGYVVDEAHQNNKVLVDLMKRRKKETGTILKNTLYKTQIQFSELFNKKYTKEFDENLDIDPDTFNLLLEDEMKNIFYNQIIKDRIKYEKQLHDDLLKINNIIYKRKNEKEEKTKRSKELYKESIQLKKEYNEQYTKNRKTYWIRYDGYEHYYNSLISNDINTKMENKDDSEDAHTSSRLTMKNLPVTDKKFSYSPDPRKRRVSILSKNVLTIHKNNMKRLQHEKKFKLMHLNNEMNSKLKEIESFYGEKIGELNNEQKKLENDIKIHKLEINYYKKINDELVREHKIYYMNKLKKGYDCRKEGLMWIVYNLLELQVPLDYHHFPKYLTHEQIDYLNKYAKAQLKQDELKIIINSLKKKQNTQRMKDMLKCMDVIDNIINFNHSKIDISENPDLQSKEFLLAKMEIDKKFLKIYQENIDIMKNYLFKNVESYELHKVIKEFKKDLYHGSNSNINASKRDVLNVFMGDKNNKNFFDFLLDIKLNYQRLEDEKQKLFINQKKNFFKLVENNMNRKASIDNVVKNEMIKRCLFGTRLE